MEVGLFSLGIKFSISFSFVILFRNKVFNIFFLFCSNLSVYRNENITGMITVGEGKAFSTGLDIKWLKSQSPTTLDEYHDELHKLYKRILSLGLTTVAIINGIYTISVYGVPLGPSLLSENAKQSATVRCSRTTK